MDDLPAFDNALVRHFNIDHFHHPMQGTGHQLIQIFVIMNFLDECVQIGCLVFRYFNLFMQLMQFCFLSSLFGLVVAVHHGEPFIANMVYNALFIEPQKTVSQACSDASHPSLYVSSVTYHRFSRQLEPFFNRYSEISLMT